MLQIKQASIQDIPLIRELTYKIWPQTYVPILSKEQIAYMLDMMYSPETLEKQMNTKHSFIICYYGDEPVGFAGYERMENKLVKLHKIYVLPEQQGKGIGKFMFGYIIEDVKNEGAEILDLNVNIYNHNAKAVYDKLGFTVVRREDIDIGNGYFMNDWGMRLYFE